jgi:hypothetical protein
MAIFNFFSKPSSNNSNSLENILAFDLDLLESKQIQWDFLDSFPNTELWIFTSNKESKKLIELQQSHLVKVLSLPEDTRQSPFWILGMVMYELQNLKDTKKITLFAPLPYYQAICDYFKLKNYPVEFVLLEPKVDKIPKTNIKQPIVKSTPSNTQNLEEKTSNEQSSEVRKSKSKKEPKIKALDPQELQKICDAFKEHFELEGIYEKKALGEIVVIATGKTLHKVFHTQNAKLYVGCLYQNQIIENVNENDFKLLKYPTIDIFPKEVKVLQKKYYKKGSRKKINS